MLETQKSLINFFRAIGILMVVFFHVLFSLAYVFRDGGAALRPAIFAFLADFPSFISIGWQAMGSEIVFLFGGFLLAFFLLREHTRHGRIDLWLYAIKRASRMD